MSFAQERLWFLEQLEPGSSLYNVSLALRLTGPLVEKALRNALDPILARHEVIRTTYSASEGVPVQVIHPPSPVDWAKLDLSTLPEGQRDDEAQVRVIQEARRPFDLSSDLMLRARLFRLALDDHILLLVMHHIATDEWSTDLLLHELSVLYNAEIDGEEPTLPKLAIQYADYALRQRERLQGSILERDLAYWKRQLEGASRLSLPEDRTRPAEPDYHGGSVAT
ncbi:MAG: condensation domain-containing protein, partial [Candidatus Bipolaricaulota bacterium]